MGIIFQIMDEISPKLTDPITKHALSVTLQKCHTVRSKFYGYILSTIAVVFMIVFFGGSMYYAYVNKPTPEELYLKTQRDQQYILSKIRFYQQQSQNRAKQSNLITNLPMP